MIIAMFQSTAGLLGGSVCSDVLTRFASLTPRRFRFRLNHQLQEVKSARYIVIIPRFLELKGHPLQRFLVRKTSFASTVEP